MIFGAFIVGFHIVLMTVAAVLAFVVLVLQVEVLAANRGRHRVAPQTDRALISYVVVVPAHNEIGTIEPTLATILPQIDSKGCVLVVADNCTDDTAVVSAAAGARVIVRDEPTRRGKSYALDFAVRNLASNPPDVVVVLDADCVPEPGTIQLLVSRCHRSGRPQQARYEIIRPEPSAGPIARVGAFAWRIKNSVRPAGLLSLGLPCLLMGTGMAFPWAIISATKLDTGHLVEDMVLGLELTASGHPPSFLPEAFVQSALPPSVEGQTSQRTRWETGHLQVIFQLVPRFILRSVCEGNAGLLALALHAAVPPLALLALLLLATLVLSGLIMAAGGSSAAFATSLGASLGALFVLVVAWHKNGRDLLSPQEMLMVPGYAVSKVALYVRVLAGHTPQWVRTKRN